MDIERRLESLKEELLKGERMVADLDMRRREARDTMLRISGAIQMLEELLNERVQPVPLRANAGD